MSEARAEQIAREVFGFAGVVTSLPSERDRNFLLRGSSGAVVLKLSHPAEDRGVVEMENAAMAHLAAVDPTLPIPRLVPSLAGGSVAVVAGDDGREHLTRMITVLQGEPAEGHATPPGLARDIGDVTARISTGLRGFFHPAAGRTHAWDIRRVADLAEHLDSVPGGAARELVARTLDRIAPTLAEVMTLPAQVEHADVTLTNVLVDGAALVGVIDFGDMHHTATVCDLAASLTSVLRSVAAQGPAAVVGAAAAHLEGYQRRRPLRPEEAGALGDLVLARLLATVLISAWRAALHPDNTAYISQYDESSWTLLRMLTSDVDVAVTMARLAGTGRIAVGQQPDPSLLARRRAVTGGRLSPLFYDRPLHVVRASGVYLYDAGGRRYLDAYNNVPVLGHSHPAVVNAVSEQLRVLTTNARYLHAHAVELAERLVATMPTHAGLDTCILVNSGSEAVDLAWRLARAATGGDGALIVEHGYHGISSATTDFSSNEWPPGYRPDHVATYAAPHRLAAGGRPGGVGAAERVDRAVAELRSHGHAPALLLLDPMFTSEGILEGEPGFMQGLADSAHAAGALVLADEVQSGFGRTGPQLWSFARTGLVPELVTLGKPMGNGYPVAAVLTRSDIAASLASSREYFSTFAGGPVPAIAALTVLDVLQDSRIPEQAVETGDYLRDRLRDLAGPSDQLGEVRGVGLVAGVDVVAAPGGPSAGEMARSVVDGLRARGVLIGATGQGGHVLKIRPPLVWTRTEVDELVEVLGTELRVR